MAEDPPLEAPVIPEENQSSEGQSNNISDASAATSSEAAAAMASASGSRSNSQDDNSLGAIFRTAYTSNSSRETASGNGGSSAAGRSTEAAGVSGSGSRLSTDADLFAPAGPWERADSRLFAESDHDVDEVEPPETEEDDVHQALFVDTSSPRLPIGLSMNQQPSPGPAAVLLDYPMPTEPPLPLLPSSMLTSTPAL